MLRNKFHLNTRDIHCEIDKASCDIADFARLTLSDKPVSFVTPYLFTREPCRSCRLDSRENLSLIEPNEKNERLYPCLAMLFKTQSAAQV